MSLPDFKFYTDNYHGISVPAEDWPRLSAQADREIKYFEREFTVTGDQESRDVALCAIADSLHTLETAASNIMQPGDGGAVSSISIGSVSTSYKTPDVKSLGLDFTDEGVRRTVYNLLKKHMSIYRGVC